MQVPPLTGPAGTVGVILAIIIGLVNCFFGYRLFRIILAIWGFVVGGAIAAGIAFNLAAATWVVILAGVLGGIIGAVLSVVLYFVGLFFLGAGLGALLGGVINAAIGVRPLWIIPLVLAIIGGILAIVLQKFMVILSTSFGGAAAVVAGVFYFIGDKAVSYRQITSAPLEVVSRNWILLLAWIVLGILGMVLQFTVTARDEPERVVRST